MVDIHSEEYILGQNIRKYRLRLGWSQADLSNAVDIDRADISKYENGAKGIMSSTLLRKFAKALGVTMDALMDEEEPENTAASIQEKYEKLSSRHQEMVKETIDAFLFQERHDSAFDLATYIARRFGVRMGNAEERAFITGDGVGKPLGLLAETGGAKVGVTAAQKDAVTFDEIFKLYYALKAPYRKKAQFLCNEALVLQLMTIKDNNGNYIWKPGLEIGKPDTLLNRPLKTSAFMPEIKGGSKVMAFGDYSYYWVADRQNRTFRRLNELYARTDQVGFLTTQRVDGKLILPEAVQLLQMAPQG